MQDLERHAFCSLTDVTGNTEIILLEKIMDDLILSLAQSLVQNSQEENVREFTVDNYALPYLTATHQMRAYIMIHKLFYLFLTFMYQFM